MAAHSSILTRRIPGTEEPGGYIIHSQESNTTEETEHKDMLCIRKYKCTFLLFIYSTHRINFTW